MNYRNALSMTRRKDPLQVFLEDPDVPIDTNPIERQTRPIPFGNSQTWRISTVF